MRVNFSASRNEMAEAYCRRRPRQCLSSCRPRPGGVRPIAYDNQYNRRERGDAKRRQHQPAGRGGEMMKGGNQRVRRRRRRIVGI